VAESLISMLSAFNYEGLTTNYEGLTTNYEGLTTNYEGLTTNYERIILLIVRFIEIE
jgi:hypothetical protein